MKTKETTTKTIFHLHPTHRNQIPWRIL